ncbi:Spindle pole body protein [Handroanthus impetiginosus]|uniref:Spindle pole body protein n=1 Tax=Handroanthus impetiginosus TaxID=429701 RepID=A0A2G9GRC8_9LAMI|nr:Spindle pole body protein [Handroanthus impetiginosus]
MTVKSAAAHHCKKAVAMGLWLFRRGFNPSKCKTMAKMAVARVKLLRNKREVVIKQMRRDIAMLLESGQDSTARIRVEHVIREQNIMAANELIELFCELVVARLSIIAKQRECPADLKEGISSLIFAGPRCSDIPELLSIRDVFQKKYGKDFVSAATDLRPNAGVNRMLIEKLSVKTPSGELKLKVLKEIAKEYQVQWDTAESEVELLKPPEERIEGPNNFVSATSLPLKQVPKQTPEPNTASNREQTNILDLQDLASAAGAAAEKAVAAAEAAARLAAHRGKPMSASGKFMPNSLPNPHDEYYTGDQYDDDHRTMKTNSSEYSHRFTTNNNESVKDDRKMFRRQSYNCQRAHTDIKFDESDCDEEIEAEEPPSFDNEKINRRHSYNVPPGRSDVRYDESNHDDDESGEVGLPTGGGTYRPPDRPAPQAPGRRVHPKLPDYDAIAARFEALKHNKRQP